MANEQTPQVLKLAGFAFSEGDGTRTRNHRIDSPLIYLFGDMATTGILRWFSPQF